MNTAVIVSEDDVIQPRKTKASQLFRRWKQSFWYLVSLETMETASYTFCSHWNMAFFILLPKSLCDIIMHDGILPEYSCILRP